MERKEKEKESVEGWIERRKREEVGRDGEKGKKKRKCGGMDRKEKERGIGEGWRERKKKKKVWRDG